jgi:hypothetical protein
MPQAQLRNKHEKTKQHRQFSTHNTSKPEPIRSCETRCSHLASQLLAFLSFSSYCRNYHYGRNNQYCRAHLSKERPLHTYLDNQVGCCFAFCCGVCSGCVKGVGVGTNTIRAYDTTPPPGSKVVTTLSADAGTVTTVGANAGVTGSILSTRRAAGRSSYANAAAGRNSYANAARRALKLPARLA